MTLQGPEWLTRRAARKAAEDAWRQARGARDAAHRANAPAPAAPRRWSSLYRARGLGARAAAVGQMAALGVTATVTLGGFSPSIANAASGFSSGLVQLEESNGTTTCYSSNADGGATCAINALNGTLDQVPGGTPLTSTITLTNVSKASVSDVNLVTGACSASAAADDSGYAGSDTAGFCGQVEVTIADTTPGADELCVYPQESGTCPALSSSYTLSSLANLNLAIEPSGPLSSHASATYVVTVALNPQAADTDQGLSATVPMSWSISS